LARDSEPASVPVWEPASGSALVLPVQVSTILVPCQARQRVALRCPLKQRRHQRRHMLTDRPRQTRLSMKSGSSSACLPPQAFAWANNSVAVLPGPPRKQRRVIFKVLMICYNSRRGSALPPPRNGVSADLESLIKQCLRNLRWFLQSSSTPLTAGPSIYAAIRFPQGWISRGGALERGARRLPALVRTA